MIFTLALANLAEICSMMCRDVYQPQRYQANAHILVGMRLARDAQTTGYLKTIAAVPRNAILGRCAESLLLFGIL